MARTTYVQKAQQRYEMVPVIDPATGEQKRTAVMDSRTGEQKQSKRGPVWMLITAPDLTKPLPNLICESCKDEITVGSPYKHVTPKSGPYGGRKRVRCATCPTWHAWDLSNSLSARLAQVAYEADMALSDVDSTDDADSAKNDAAEAVREIAGEKQESADNIESGFGHPTSASEELADIAQQLESWADEIEATDVPEYPEPEEGDCEDCDGTGRVDPEKLDVEQELDENNQVECETCSGSGQNTPDEPTEDQIENWRQEVIDNLSLIGEPPV